MKRESRVPKRLIDEYQPSFPQRTLAYRHVHLHENLLHSQCFHHPARCFCDTDNKSAGYKESYEAELPKLPCHKADSKIFRTPTNLVPKRAKFNVDFEISRPFRKTSVRDEKLSLVSPTVRKSPEFFL